MTTTNTEFRIGVAGVLFASLVWGTTGTAAAFAPQVSAAAIGAAAMGIGGLLQALIALKAIVRAKAELRRHWPLLVAGGIAVAIYPLAFYGSMRLAGVTIGTVVTIGSAPLLSALIERLFDKARLSARWLAGAALGLFGMVLLCLAEGWHGQTTPVAGSATLAGTLLGLLGGLTYALYSWTARGLMLRGIPAGAAMGATFGVGGLLLMPVLLATGAPFLASWSNAAVGVYMATVPMFLGYIAFGIGLARIPASMATTILAVIVIGERLPVLGWVGVALIIVCLVVITAPPRRVRPKLRTATEQA
jgi:drug/metabolite transporter, DME family